MEPSAASLALKLPDVYPGGVVPVTWKRCVQLKLENPGINLKEIGKVLGVNQQTVGGWTRQFAYQQYENWCISKLPPEVSTLIEKDQKDALVRVREKFETYLDDMQDRLMLILETTESEKLQVEIIQDAFDRTGFASKKDAPRSTPFIFTPDAVREFFNRAEEAGLARVDRPVGPGATFGGTDPSETVEGVVVR